MTYRLPKNGEQRGGDRWDSASRAWVPAATWQERQWDREERAFQRRANQGELQCPMVISDSTGKDLQSQVTGRWHDSKSTLRKEYRERGFLEVGNDVPTTRFIHGNKPPEDPHKDRKQMDAIGKAFQRVGLPTV